MRSTSIRRSRKVRRTVLGGLPSSDGLCPERHRLFRKGSGICEGVAVSTATVRGSPAVSSLTGRSSLTSVVPGGRCYTRRHCLALPFRHFSCSQHVCNPNEGDGHYHKLQSYHPGDWICC